MTTDLCKLTGRDKSHLVQLCLPIEKAKTRLKFPMLASEKLDGVFCLARYNPDYECPSEKVTIYSRTGEVYTSMEHLKEELCTLMKITGSDYIIFEAYYPFIPQPIISGWCRDTKEQHPELRAYVHDCLSIDEFNGEFNTPYEKRVEILMAPFIINRDFRRVFPISQTFVYDEDQLWKLADDVWARGGEGLVLREPTAPYCPGKRNYTMLKVKKGVSYDLKVVALEEGKGKYKNMVGKLVCRWKNGDVIKVGSGLTDEQRKRWWTEFAYDEIVNKVVQIDAMAESSKGKLREPIFKGIRHDKLKGDY